MPPSSMINYWALLVLTSTLLVFPTVPINGAPPLKKAHSSPKKHLPPKHVTYPDLAFLYQLPPAASKGRGNPADFRSAKYVDAAVRLQSVGKVKACQDLVRLAEWEDNWNDGSSENAGYRAIVLCRMLFVARAGQEFRRAETGGAEFIAGTTYSDWPLEPIILIDQVPFVIAAEYGALGGFPESTGGYVYYCIQNCDWSNAVYHPLTQSQEEQALQKLYALPVWKGGLSDDDKAVFARQISLPGRSNRDTVR